MVKCNKRKEKFVDIWTGQYVTFAKAKGSGEIYAWGLNNYYQLGNRSIFVSWSLFLIGYSMQNSYGLSCVQCLCSQWMESTAEYSLFIAEILYFPSKDG